MTPAIINRLWRKRPGTAIIDWTGVPLSMRGRYSAVVHNSHEAEALVTFFTSPRWVPAGPVLLLTPNGTTIIGIDQKQHPMTAAMLRDQAMAAFEHELDTLNRSGGGGLVLRERGGPLEPKDVAPQVGAALIRQRVEREGGI